MHEHLRAAVETLGVQLDALESAAEQTAHRTTQAREQIRNELGEVADVDVGLDIVAFGSMARQEMSPGSDFDYLVVVHEVGRANPRVFRQYREAAEEARLELGADKPGISGLFGALVAAPNLVDVIGTDADSNQHHSRRILMLEESVSLKQDDSHQKLLRRIIERYLFDYGDERAPRVPRFLLNDIVRYWRVVGVDYQAKRWYELEAEKWGLRYIKLRSTRKLTFAATLTSLFGSPLSGQPLDAEYLLEQVNLPPLARLAQIVQWTEHEEALEALRDVLVIADRFVGWLAEDKFRSAMNDIADPWAAPQGSRFVEARDATVELQLSLERLFFAPAPLEAPVPGAVTLGDLSRKYLTF